MSRFSLKTAIAFAVSVLIVGLILFLLMRGGPEDGLGGIILEGDRAAVPVPEGAAPRDAPPAPDTAAAVQAEEEPGDEPEEERLPLLSGTVFGERGPLPGATVRAYPFAMIKELISKYESLSIGGLGDIPALIRQVRSDVLALRGRGIVRNTGPDGRYAFVDIAPGEYVFLVLGAGHLFRAGDTTLIVEDEAQVMDFALHAGQVIAGRVVDAEGAPVAGASVLALYQVQGMAGLGKFARKLLGMVSGEFLSGPFMADTDAGGAFRFDTLPPGVYELDVAARGHAECRVPDIAVGTQDVVIQLGAGGMLRGRLVQEDGTPCAGLPVKLVATEDKIQIPFPMPGLNEVVESFRHFFEEKEDIRDSSAEGDFAWERLRPGAYELRIEPADFLPRVVPFAIGEGETLDLGTIVLDGGATVRGVVLTTDERPVGNAIVCAQAEGVGEMQMVLGVASYLGGRNRAVTGEDGTFVLRGLQRGPSVRVVASHARLGVGFAAGVIPDGEAVKILLNAPWRITGRVIRASSGSPVAYAEVYAGGAETRTDDEGIFVLDPVVPDANQTLFAGIGGGRMGRPGGQGIPGAAEGQAGAPRRGGQARTRIFARAEGLMPADRFLTEEEARDEIVIELSEQIALEGIVLLSDGRPRAGAPVRLVPGRLPPVGGFEMLTLGVTLSDREGKFRLGDLRPPMEIKAIAAFPGYASAESEVFRIRAGEPLPFVELVLGPGGRIAGLVTDGRAPVAGVKLRLHAAQERSMDARAAIFLRMFGIPEAGRVTHSNYEGRFFYDDLTPGAYVVSASAGAGITRSVPVDVPPEVEQRVTIEIEVGGTISGVVIDRGGYAVPLAAVRLLDSGNQSLLGLQKAFGGSTVTGTTDQLGGFAFTQVRSGLYTVIAHKDGFAPAEVANVRVDGDPVTIVLDPQGALAGQVRFQDTGEPVPVFQVRLDRPQDGERWTSPLKGWRVVEEPAGIFVYDGLAAGKYLVEVRAGGAAPQTVTVDVAPGEESFVEVLLDLPCVVTGTVVRGEELLPVARARVSLAAAQRSGASSAGEAFGGFMEDRIQEIATNTSRDGAFVLTDLPAGTLTIEATHQQFRPGRVQVTLEPGQEVTVQIVLREGFDLSGTILDYLGNPEIERAVLVEGADNVQKVTRTSGDGTWSVSGLVAGTYRVWCPGPDLAEELPPRQVEVNSDISGVTITLPPPRDVAPPGEVPADPFPQSPPEVPDDLLDAWRGGGVPAGGTR